MKKPVVLICSLLGVVSLVVAIIYLTNSAGNLPHFFIGYAKGSTHKHIKHAIAAIALAVILFLTAWMLSGDQSRLKSSEIKHKEDSKDK